MADGLARLSGREALRLGARVGLPFVAAGLIQRRPVVVGALTRIGADRWPVAELARLRARHRASLLVVDLPGRTIALPMDADAVRRVLTGPEFTPANREKKGALAQFQPHGLLISPDGDREVRRRFTESVLQTPRELHSAAAHMSDVVSAETAGLLNQVRSDGELRWDAMAATWWRIVRRVVLGDAARDDVDLISRLQRLRSAGNWSFAFPTRTRDRARFHEHLTAHLRRAEPGSLAAAIAERAEPGTEPTSQVAHWLFAFDAAVMTAMRTLVLLSAHPDVPRSDARHLRAAVLDTVRLYPTTPAILRDSTADTDWAGETLPAGTAFAVLAPFFHRDPELPYADAFEPRQWLDGRAARNPTLLPFSAGPAGCPGRNLVLHLTSTFVAALLAEGAFAPDATVRHPLPPGIDPFHKRLTRAARPQAVRTGGLATPE